MIENLKEWFPYLGWPFFLLLFFYLIKWMFFWQRPEPQSKKFNGPKFKNSGWVLFYVIFGWISLALMIVFFAQDNSTFAFMMLGCSLSCFFAAHVLRLQEKVAFQAEQQTIHAERQTELLKKISSEKSPIIEDKEK